MSQAAAAGYNIVLNTIEKRKGLDKQLAAGIMGTLNITASLKRCTDPVAASRALLDPVEGEVASHHQAQFADHPCVVAFWADDPDQGVGSEIVADGTVELTVEVQSPTWFDVDRVEVYENGTLIHVWEGIAPNSDVLNLFETLEVTPSVDSWYVVAAMSDDSLAPLFTPVEWPAIQLQDVVIEALGSVEAIGSLLGESVDQPRTFPTHPYAITNPIWVDVDGQGWTPPGLPTWLVPPEEPGGEQD